MAFDSRLTRITNALAASENPLNNLADNLRRYRESLQNGTAPPTPEWMKTPEGIAERARAMRAAMLEAKGLPR